MKKIRGIGDTPEGAVGDGNREGAGIQILAFSLDLFQGGEGHSL